MMRSFFGKMTVREMQNMNISLPSANVQRQKLSGSPPE
jgi:hypothetical protein